jgi:hypothetical protein
VAAEVYSKVGRIAADFHCGHADRIELFPPRDHATGLTSGCADSDVTASLVPQFPSRNMCFSRVH